MSGKTIFIILTTTLVTIILMKNTDEVTFWIFGNHNIPKLAVLGVMFGLGLIIGYLAGRPKKRSIENDVLHDDTSFVKAEEEWIDPDSDYIN